MHHGRKNYFWLVLVIVILAGFFRLYKIDSIPPGLYPDEAMNGSNALQALETDNFKAFYPENNGREGMFINLQAISVSVFGNHAWALRIVSAFAGILTVLGLYFLTKELFARQIGLIASFLLAVSFWHVNFSRIGFRAIMAPLFLVWMLYFLWRGMSTTHKLPYILSGIMLGLGFQTYISFRIMPLVLLLVVCAYLDFIKKDFAKIKPDSYRLLKNKLFKGLLAMVIAATIVLMPLLAYFASHPEDILGRTSQISIFSTTNPIKVLVVNTFQTLAMFNFAGDNNWRHNISGVPQLVWPIGIFFVIGLFFSIYKMIKMRRIPHEMEIRSEPSRSRTGRAHGHFSTAHTLLLSTFIVGLLPVVISSEGLPHALRAIIVVPIVYIFAAQGMWHFFEKLKDWYSLRDPHIRERILVSAFVIVVLLISIAFVEYDRYFNQWGRNLAVASEFNASYSKLADKLNHLPTTIKKYVVVAPRGGARVNGLSLDAQPIMFLTDTNTPSKQKAKNIYYITTEQFRAGEYDRDSLILPLK